MTPQAMEALLREALDNLLASSGARGVWDASKHFEAVKVAEALLAQPQGGEALCLPPAEEREGLAPDAEDIRLIFEGVLPGCPCCNGTPVTFARFFPHSGIYQSYVHCSHCDVQVFKNARDREEARQLAVKAWSKRPAALAQPEREAIEQAIQKRLGPLGAVAVAEAADQILAIGGRATPFAHFQWNTSWKAWEQVAPQHDGEGGVIAAYGSAPARPEFGWQDISTALKDGTPIDVWSCASGGFRIPDVIWEERYQAFFSEEEGVIMNDLTHWMLPPAPPTKDLP